MVVEQRGFGYMRGLKGQQVVVASILLAVVVALGWYFMVGQARDAGDAMAGTMGMSVGAFLVMWLPMVVAMMFLTVGVSAVSAVVGDRASVGLPVVTARAAIFLVVYLAVWMVFGLAVYLVLVGAREIVSISPENEKWLAAGVYLVAGVYQFLPAKDRCRESCRATTCSGLNETATPGGRIGNVVTTATRHGLTCIGCCIGFMVVLIAVGMTNLLAMALLAVVIFVERFVYPRTVTRIAGALLILAAVLTPFVEWLHPGLPGSGAGDMPSEPM
jgi:predicted metal-binding membrane protein